MTFDIEISKGQLFKVFPSGKVFGALLGKLAGSLIKVDISLAKNISARLATMALALAIHGAIQRKMSGRGVVRAEKGIILAISNKNIDDIITIIKLLENLSILIDGIGKTINIKWRIKKMDYLVYC